MDAGPLPLSGPIGIIAGGGALPFAVAEELIAGGRKPYILAIRGACAEGPLSRFDHQWIALGEFGRVKKLLKLHGCRDIVFIGSLVRPALSELRFDLQGLRHIRKVYAAFRGGDDHLLTTIATLFEDAGYRILGVQDVAPGLLMPQGCLTRRTPDARDEADIAKGLEVLRALGPFDIGQAVVVIDGHVVSVEDIGGTDSLLARVADLRKMRRIRYPVGCGVLIKAPKSGQDLRLDLPTLGPTTIESLVAAELAGSAIVAGSALIAEPQKVIAAADASRLFVTGVAG
jgi:DUF1009 family protein